jgi:diguanylate cyclase (GGDEF)-like protein
MLHGVVRGRADADRRDFHVTSDRPDGAGSTPGATRTAAPAGSPRRRRRQRPLDPLAVVVAAGGTTWLALYALGVLGPLAGATFPLLGTMAIAATLVGVRRYRPAPRWPWWSIGGAIVIWQLGGAARAALGTMGDLSPGRSLLPDLVSLAGYGLFGAGLGGFVRARQRERGRDFDAVLDGAVAALAFFTLAWVFLVAPAVAEVSAPLRVRLTLACYPPVSVFLLALAVRLSFSTGRSSTASQRLLLGAIAMMLAGDVAYMLADTRLVALPGRWLDLPYAVAYLLFALNALHPTMTELGEPVTLDQRPPGRTRLTLVAGALAVPAAVILSRHDFRGGDRVVLVVTVLALTGTAVGRVARALHAQARSEARSAYQATHDSLTDLPNRAYLVEYLERRLRQLRAGQPPLALLFLDIDRFKAVNDTGGHALGDALLLAAAERLRRTVRAGDLVARLGGDEFVVALPSVVDIDEALVVAERARTGFHRPFLVEGNDLYATTSVGVALAGPAPDLAGRSTAGTPGAEDLVRDADTAMYHVKQSGRDGVAVFDASMRDRAARRLLIEHHLRRALPDGGLYLVMQPIVRLEDGSVTGFEALLRWRHRTLGNVTPGEFIPVAEETGLIDEIGAWVLERACAALARCRREAPEPVSLSVAVNVSARQLRDPALFAVLDRCLRDYDLPAEALCLELTESLLMQDPDAAAETLRSLRARGVHLSIDDFGTGYSSLSYLKQFPVDTVKIDRSFVEGLDVAEGSDVGLVSAIIAMADALGMSTVAEGVENEGQRRRLHELGCDRAQGYLFSRPVPVGDAPEIVRGLAPPALVLADCATD